MTGLLVAVAAVGATLLRDGVNALADWLGRRDDLNLPVSLEARPVGSADCRAAALMPRGRVPTAALIYVSGAAVLGLVVLVLWMAGV